MSKTGYFQYNMRTVVHSAVGGIIRLPSLFDGLGGKRVLLISDAGLKAVGIVDQIVRVFENNPAGTTAKLVGVHAEITPDAGCEAVNKCLAHAREVAADAILAVGGGSVLDAAKGVKYGLHHNVTDFKTCNPRRYQTGYVAWCSANADSSYCCAHHCRYRCRGLCCGGLL